MSKVERAVAEGCLVGLACLVVLIVAIWQVGRLVGMPDSIARVLHLFPYFFAFSIAGNFACRRARTTGWTQSLWEGGVVGLAAELFVVFGVFEHITIRDILAEPGRNISHLVLAALPIPAAMLGAVVWVKTSGINQAGKQPEGANTDDAQPNAM